MPQDASQLDASQGTSETSLAHAVTLVTDFLEKSMVPDPDAAAQHLAADVVIHFTGATLMSHPREMAAYNARRYKWVKKQLGEMNACTSKDSIVVYSFGTLYGQWLDGEDFSDNRYVDRFVVEDGKIVKIDVLNDSAERILKRTAAIPGQD